MANLQSHHRKKKRGYTLTVILIIAMLVIVFTVFFSCSATSTVDNTSVERLDLNNYLGGTLN